VDPSPINAPPMPSAGGPRKRSRATAALVTGLLAATMFAGSASPANVAAYEAGQPVVSDSMTRTVSGSWGQTPGGIQYTSTARDLSVVGGIALMPLSTSSTATTVRSHYELVDSESTVKVRIPELPTGSSGVYASLSGRDSGSGNYRATLRVLPTGTSVMEISRWNSGVGTALASVDLPLTATAGQEFSLKLRVTGNSAPVIQGKAWLAGRAEPSNWSASFTDSSAGAVTTKGMTSVTGYRGAGSQAMTLSFDDLTVRPLTAVSGSSTTPAPAPDPAQTPAPTPDVDSTYWSPAYSDEFDGTSLAKWTVRDDSTHGVLSYDRAVIFKGNARVADGVLHLEGKKLSSPVIKRGERWFSTGYLDTIGKFSQKYGRWEMRAKLPLTANNSKGIWPAFWLRPDGGATGGEIDIMEAYGTPTAVSFSPQDRAGTTLHYDQTGENKTSAWIPVTPTLSSAFHTWTFEWTPQGMKWLFDGQVYKTVDRTNNLAYEAAFETSAKFNIRLNMQYGSPYWGMPDPSNSSVTKNYADYQVDYVRAWSYNG
jgi:beta-glucanase (GH16 family)